MITSSDKKQSPGRNRQAGKYRGAKKEWSESIGKERRSMVAGFIDCRFGHMVLDPCGYRMPLRSHASLWTFDADSGKSEYGVLFLEIRSYSEYIARLGPKNIPDSL
jgi:hypothetical protein